MDSLKSLFRGKKDEEIKKCKVMKNSHAANTWRYQIHTKLKSNFACLGLRRSLSEIKIPYHRKDSITAFY